MPPIFPAGRARKFFAFSAVGGLTDDDGGSVMRTEAVRFQHVTVIGSLEILASHD